MITFPELYYTSFNSQTLASCIFYLFLTTIFSREKILSSPQNAKKVYFLRELVHDLVTLLPHNCHLSENFTCDNNSKMQDVD